MATYRFGFHGGVTKLTMHSQERFLLFFIVDGKEVPHYQMMKNGLLEAQQARDVNDHDNPGKRRLVFTDYQTYQPYGKLFVSERGFGVQSRYYSFYFKLIEAPAAKVTIHPFRGTESDFFFSSYLKFLNKEEVLALLGEGSESAKFMQRQLTLPIEVMQRMVTVDKSDLKKGVRVVRIGSDTK